MRQQGTLRLYGGIAHGRIVNNFDSMDTHVTVSTIDPHGGYMGYDMPELEHYYAKKRYGEVRRMPTRRRSVEVGVHEGYELSQSDVSDIQKRAEHLRWEVDQASILDDFDQWFAEVVYRRFGILWWRSGPVPE